MSAMISFAQGDLAFVLTDRAGYDSEGVVRQIGRKITVADPLPFAVATRGDKAMGSVFSSHIVVGVRRFGIDLFLDEFGGWLESLGNNPDIRTATAGQKTVEVLIAGWSAARGAFHFTVRTDGDDAFKLVTPGNMFFGVPLDVEPTVADFEMPLPGEDLMKWAIRTGADTMEFFRRQKGILAYDHSAPGFYGVGGGVDLTIITPAGAHTETLRIWPDVVGETIDPERKAA